MVEFIIGIKMLLSNLSNHFNLLDEKQLQKNYSVIAIEVEKRDFAYFKEKDMFSVPASEVGNMIAKHSDFDVILIDTNNNVSPRHYMILSI